MPPPVTMAPNGYKILVRSRIAVQSLHDRSLEVRPDLLEAGSPAQQEAATRYAPAEALGNRRVGPRPQPVEDMVAEGPGTIAAAGRIREPVSYPMT
jgi:hypothetical protein